MNKVIWTFFEHELHKSNLITLNKSKVIIFVGLWVNCQELMSLHLACKEFHLPCKMLSICGYFLYPFYE